MDQISVIVIDSDSESRRKTEITIRNLSHVSVEGSAGELQSGYRLVQQIKPQIVILSLDPGLDEAIALIEKISLSFPGMEIFASASNKQPDVILRAIRAGAKEFLVRPISPDELTAAVGKVARAWIAKLAMSTNPGKVVSVF